MVTSKSADIGILQKGTLTSQNHSFARLITLLLKDGANFPVYWSHYASWLAIAKLNLERLRIQASSTHMNPFGDTHISAVNFEWTKLSLELLQDVNAQVTGIYPGVMFF